MTKNWQNIIWREINNCNDPDYAENLQLAFKQGYFSFIKKYLSFRQNRPLAAHLEQALHQLCQVQWSGKDIWGIRLRRLEREKSQLKAIDELIADLENSLWFKRFLARHLLFHRGGEAIASLNVLRWGEPSDIQPIAAWLIESICHDTKNRLAKNLNHLICPHCFARLASHKTHKIGVSTFYGCRKCFCSCNLHHAPNGIIAVLNNNSTTQFTLKEGILHVNWCVYRQVFDFDHVEIIQATDEEAERFAIQVGNDTDELREARHTRIDYQISPQCQLSPTTLRLLDNTLGDIEDTK